MSKRRPETRSRERGVVRYYLPLRGAGEIRRNSHGDDLTFSSTVAFAAGEAVTFETVRGGREALAVERIGPAPVVELW